MTLMKRAPVALFVFNRPALTAQVLEAVARARPTRLLVVGDGPRGDHPGDPKLVRDTRALIDRVDWPCEVLTCYSDHNLGCGRRFATGLDWVFANAEEAIILEDDCVPDHTFFRFCEELLERHRDDERVQMICGCNVTEPGRFGPYSYYFSRCYHIWGWATWSRAWRHYDYDMQGWPELRGTRWLEQLLGSRRAGRITQLLFDETYSGRIDQWDFQWVFAGWTRNAVSAIPTVNLVSNVGFGDRATHLHDPGHPRANLATMPMEFPLRHPVEVSVLEEADRAEWESVFAEYARFVRRRRWLELAEALQTPLTGAVRAGRHALTRLGGFRRDRPGAG
jgi:hypothetical protein